MIVQLLRQVWEGGQQEWVKVSEGYQSAGMGHMPIKRPKNWQVYFIQKISLSVSEHEGMFFLSNILEKQLSSMDLHFYVFLLSFLVVMWIVA